MSLMVQGPPSLTPREKEVLRLMCRGFVTDSDLARVLIVSEHTAHYHVGQLRSKLDLRERAQVVAYALTHGLVDQSEVDWRVQDQGAA